MVYRHGELIRTRLVLNTARTVISNHEVSPSLNSLRPGLRFPVFIVEDRKAATDLCPLKGWCRGSRLETGTRVYAGCRNWAGE